MSENSVVTQRINEAFKKSHMTRNDLMKKTGLSKSAISYYLSGKVIPKQDKVFLLAKALKVSPSWLIGIDSDRSEFHSQFGTDQELKEYFADQPQLLDMYREIQQSDSLRLLFDSTKDLSPEDLKPVLEYIYTIRKAKGLE